MNRVWFVLIAAVCCGLLLGTIHPPYNLSYIGVFGLPLSYWLAQYSDRPKLVGYGLGFGYFFLTMSWITSPFQVEKDIFGWMAYPAWILMAAGLALFWLPAFALYRRGVLIIAATFIALELLRGWIFTGFPWALIGYGFIDTPIAMSSAFIGAYGLSAALVFAMLAIFGPTKIHLRGIGVVVIGFLMLPHFLRNDPDIIENANFKVTLVQANITQAESFDASRAEEFLNAQIDMSQGDADLVVWPEGATRYSPSYDPSLISTITQKMNGQGFLFGAIHFDDFGRFYNAAYLVDENGKNIYRYDKQHLVPFGEYIPFGNAIAKLGIATQTLTRFSMSKGSLYPWPDSQFPKFNILICYEGIFPKYAQREGGFIALITNDSWFGNGGGPVQHLVAARFRAIESGKPLVRSAKTGISAFVSAKGELISHVPLNTKGAITSAIGPRYDGTIYSKIRNWPLYIFLFAALIIGFRRA